METYDDEKADGSFGPCAGGCRLASAALSQQTHVNEMEQAMSMSENGTKNLEAAKTFFLALEQHDVSMIEPFLAPEIREIIPFSNTGAPEPWAAFDGKEAVLGYLGVIVKNFSKAVLLEKQFTVSHDGNVVFLEAKGDLVHAASGAPYKNVYVFKFTFEDGLMSRISEYANPVTYAKLAGEPLG